MGNNKYQLYAMAVLGAALFCADQWGRQWFVDVAIELFEAPGVGKYGTKAGAPIALEIPKTPFGEQYSAEAEEDCDFDGADHACLAERNSASDLGIMMSEVELSGNVKMASAAGPRR